jgi:galactokinase
MVDPRPVVQEFRRRYHTQPRVFRAPGRVNLIGEHTDYNDGFVMPVAINRDTVVAASSRDDQLIKVYSTNLKSEATIDLAQPTNSQPGDWWAYVEGVVRVMMQNGASLQGADLLIESDVPEGAGLSSSAALELSVATAFAQLYNSTFDKTQLALFSQQAEHEYAGTLCGIMDQFVSAHGTTDHALLIDCRSLTFERIPLRTEGAVWVVFDSGVKHNLASSEYNVRRAECHEAVEILQSRGYEVQALRDVEVGMLEASKTALGNILYCRAHHVVTENQRTQRAAEALRAGDPRTVGSLMLESHRSLQYDYEVSCAELDFLVDLAVDHPACYGGRMTGGGFGGSTVNLVKREGAKDLITKASKAYLKQFGSELRELQIQVAGGAGEIRT